VSVDAFVRAAVEGRRTLAEALLMAQPQVADPNGFFVNEHGRMSALYGAAGIKHDPALTRVLLEAGADPDDGESLYHAASAESPDCMRVLLEHGATVVGSNAVAGAPAAAKHPEAAEGPLADWLTRRRSSPRPAQ
jgi:hypothetical protein